MALYWLHYKAKIVFKHNNFYQQLLCLNKYNGISLPPIGKYTKKYKIRLRYIFAKF